MIVSAPHSVEALMEDNDLHICRGKRKAGVLFQDTECEKERVNRYEACKHFLEELDPSNMQHDFFQEGTTLLNQKNCIFLVSLSEPL